MIAITLLHTLHRDTTPAASPMPVAMANDGRTSSSNGIGIYIDMLLLQYHATHEKNWQVGCARSEITTLGVPDTKQKGRTWHMPLLRSAWLVGRAVPREPRRGAVHSPATDELAAPARTLRTCNATNKSRARNSRAKI